MDNLSRLDFARSRDERLLDLAAMQHRIVRRSDLDAIGFTRSATAHAVRSGRLHRVRRGIFAVGTPALDTLGEILAAVFAFDDAVASHRTAAALWRFGRHPTRIEITAPTRRRSAADLLVHQTRSLAEGDRRIWLGIPVTSPERTLTDLADVLYPDALDQALADAHYLGYVDRTVAHRRGRRAVGRRRLTRSQLERAFLRRARAGGLSPETNVRLGRWEADVFFRDAGIVVEIDHYRTHGSERSFERDRTKANDLVRLGLRVLRVTEDTLDDVVALLVELLR